MIGISFTVKIDPMNGHDKSFQPCTIITCSFGSAATACLSCATEPWRIASSRLQCVATSYESALYRASTFQPTVCVTQSTIAVVVGAISVASSGSFARCSGAYGKGSNIVTLESYTDPSLPCSR